ncbi:MAG TPA: phosphatase PAP2 family protein [Bryobacteraceae bacterium]|nr:phosphatase PAP2 family protein [Bryobacteraceae bacterium]
MANSGQVEWRPPAGVSLSVKALLLACLPWLAYQGYNHGLYHLISTNPAAQFTYFGIAVLYFAGSSPSRKECILAVAGGLALLILCPLDRPADFPGEALVRAGAFVGIAGLFAMCARAIVSRDRDSALDTLARSLIFVVLGIALGTMLGAASSARPYKYDHFLYAVDLRFGAAISFIAGRWMRASAAYGQLELVVYHSLPMAFAVLYAAHIRRAKQGPVDILNMMALNAVVGYGLYFLYPAAGPMYAFGSSFPFAAPHQGQFALQMVNLSAPPNAMPSLHMAGAILIWWNARHWRLGRFVAPIYMFLTALAALGLGEHYFLDLVVAFPYALAIQAMAAKSALRWPAMALGTAMTACWFLALLFAPAELSALPVWAMWGLAAISVACPVMVNARLLSELPSAAPQAAPRMQVAFADAPRAGGGA